MRKPICSADGCNRTESCGFACRDNGNLDKPTEQGLSDTSPYFARVLREGEVMGAYMEFDRKANKAWTPAEYLVKFGLHISECTIHGLGGKK